jgi:hypothetical protein
MQLVAVTCRCCSGHVRMAAPRFECEEYGGDDREGKTSVDSNGSP